METVFRRLCTVLLGALRPACKPMLDVNIPIEDGSSESLHIELIVWACYTLTASVSLFKRWYSLKLRILY